MFLEEMGVDVNLSDSKEFISLFEQHVLPIEQLRCLDARAHRYLVSIVKHMQVRNEANECQTRVILS